MGSAGYDKQKRIPENEEIENGALKKPIFDDELEKLYDSIPKNQYLCPYCGSIPELVNIFTDNGCIEFKCKCKEELPFKVDDYFKELSESKYTYFNTYCSNCNRVQKDFRKEDQIFKYCYMCKKDYCFDCLKEHPKNHLEQCIRIDEKTSKCLRHFEESEFTAYCKECNDNICSRIYNSEHTHEGHDTINFSEIDVKKNIIIEKNKTLYSMIKFNELILQTYENFPNNYFHIINTVNLVKSIELENSRNAKELDEAFKKLKTKINSQNKIIEELNAEFKLSLTVSEEYLNFRSTNFTDEYLNKLKVFTKIIHLDLSYNNIHNIDCLKSMNTSSLENLNFNNNQIESIEVFKSMNLSNLKDLGLKDNKIKCVLPLLQSNLSSLNSLRLEGNELDENSEDVEKLIKKYTKQVFLTPKTLEEFNQKYDSDITVETRIINFRDKKIGDDILQDLYHANDKFDNLKKLDLANCKIVDISNLSNISFKSLETLDLSINKIEDIKPLMYLRCRTLKYIYLNDNKIKNIIPLKLFKFEALNIITLNDNNIDVKNKLVQEIVEDYEKKGIKIVID